MLFRSFNANNQNLKMDPLEVALLGELRGRFLNRQWIEPLMKEGYSGARTMGSEFVEYLWGWQVTSPEIIQSWVWEEVKSVYIDDSLDVGLDEFLADKHNVHVQTNILAVMLVAIEKDFWQTNEATQQQLAEAFANNIIEKGIPGSGHTHANHPIYEFIKPLLDAETVAKLEQTLAASRMNNPAESAPTSPVHIQEIEVGNSAKNTADATDTNASDTNASDTKATEANKNDSTSNTENDETSEDSSGETYLRIVLGLALLLMFGGFIRARRL